MKTINWLVILIILLSVSNLSCEEPTNKNIPPSSEEAMSQAGEILKGEHTLRKIAAKIETDSKVSTSYFMFTSGQEGSNTLLNFSVRFSWRMNDGTYVISRLSLDKVRVRFDETMEIPGIKFRWKPVNSSDVQYLMDNNVIYAVVSIKETDWPIPLKTLFIVDEKK